MPSTFDNFTLGTTAGGATPIQADDYVVGFDTAVLNGERKWRVSTLAQAVSAIIDSEFVPTGGGNDKVFWENDKNVTSNYTITLNKNAMTAGPITVNSGVVVTVPSGSTWTVV
jgi:hypothetical protein